MRIRIGRGDIHLIDLQTRLPFKYGIATMTRAPQAFVRVEADIDGRAECGIAADLLPPKWFKKDPHQPLDDELDEMLRVVEHAVAASAGLSGNSVFEVWRSLDEAQRAWGRDQQLPPLLSNFGTTLVERAVIEAAAKAAGRPFAELVRDNRLGLRLDEFDWRLAGQEPAALLPARPLTSIIARQTVGMADPLTSEEIAAGERLADGLPQALVESLREYGLRHLKIKLSGDAERDSERLKRIAGLVRDLALDDFAFTLDGNEAFGRLDQFREYWAVLLGNAAVRTLFRRLLFVEQPFHRDVALDAGVLGTLRSWSDRPRMIIDESDAEWDSLPRALALGYHGTSHKNCKGVFRGIAHACLLAKLRRDEPAAGYVMSGEDLANIGPVALLQDLAAAATLGIESVERNGHHYFAGLSMFPAEVQEQVLENHNDVFCLTRQGWPAVDITNGRIDVTSVVEAPFGVGFELDVERLTPAAQWREAHALGKPSGQAQR